MDENKEFVVSNIRTFYKIAKESFEHMQKEFESGRRRKPNGEPGWILTLDPDQNSFKSALIAITFSGIYLEALLHHLIVEKKGIDIYHEYDRKPYEEKLRLLGCTTQSILSECKHYRTVRREVIHEKAHIDSETIRTAQDEATRAFKLIETINNHFGINMD